jgi:gluconate 2-dehydrogenase gamma chain
MPSVPTRRRLLQVTGAAALLPLSGLQASPHNAPNKRGAYLFFNPAEARFIEAAAARLIPDEPDSPGALAAGVPAYIDGQLAGAWGNGLQLYAQGPFKAGTPSQGYQAPFTPAQIYRLAMQGIAKALDPTPFEQRPQSEQDALLAKLDKDQMEIGPVPGSLFMASLWQNTVEGFFCDPAYGGNRGMAGWKLVGFPGAYAAYAEWVDQHNVPFKRPPIGMADRAIHPMSMPGRQHEHGG